jgi:dihydrofolate reductase
MIIGIIAIARNFAIGRDGKLPWYYPADLKFFKNTTLGSTVVMGFNTWTSLGKPLPKRLNIVLSRQKTIANQPNVLLLRSKEEVLALAKFLKGDLFIIGGARTYHEFADRIEKWIVTEIPQTIENADVFMQKDFLKDFNLQESIVLEENLRVKVFVRSNNHKNHKEKKL